MRPFSPLELFDALDHLTELQEEEPFRMRIVGNEECITEFYSTILEHAGMQATALDNSVNVLDALSDFQPELVLMDQ